MKKRYWVWKDDKDKVHIDTLRHSRWRCENFLTIRYDQGENETTKAFRKRIGGKVIRVKLVKT